ncbi:MAG: ABC transporter permease [Chloroflexota bacterium]|nr:ABC transporter permease [Chloroflexota bacterium]
MTTAIQTNVAPTTRPPILFRTIPHLACWLTLCAAMLLAVQMRLQLPLGDPLNASPEPYTAHTPALYLMFALIAVGVTLVAPTFARTGRTGERWFAPARPFRRYVVMLALAAAGTFVILPQMRWLQIAYFLAFGIVLGIAVIAAPTRFYLGRPDSDIVSDLMRLWRGRYLVRLWLQHNIESRYAQHVLGVLWIVLLPISTSIVLSVAFSQFMRVQLDVPFVAFYLSALIHFNMFSNGVAQAAVAINSRIEIIAQVYFPREILLVVTLGELIVDFTFTFAAMLVVNAISGIFPNVYFVFLPFLWLILVLIVAGTMLIASALSVIVRDVPQLAAVALQLLFFLTPVIYPVASLPDQYHFLFVINPLAPMMQAFRDIIVYARPPDALSLVFPAVVGVAALIFGYTLFKSIEDRMADMG